MVVGEKQTYRPMEYNSEAENECKRMPTDQYLLIFLIITRLIGNSSLSF